MIGMKEARNHLCGFIDCPSCHEYVPAKERKCFIQKAKSPEEEKEKRKKNQSEELRLF